MEILTKDSRMTSMVHWSREEIEKLKEDFLKGAPIKIIAKALGRSPGAVNKALTRFQVRTPRIFKEKILKYPSHKMHRLALLRERELKAKICWTPLIEVTKWLQNNGDSVTVSDGCFLINNRPMTEMQLIMHTNKKRIEQGFEIFLVEHVTW